MKYIITIGDVHGCIRELDELLNKIELISGEKRIVFLGDILDRGPESLACIRRIREIKAECVRGNHEDNFLKWVCCYVNFKSSEKSNPRKPQSHVSKSHNKHIKLEEIAWLRALPHAIKLTNDLYAIHGGCESYIPFNKQITSNLLRVRYLNSEGKVIISDENLSETKDIKFWSELWKGPESIVYGHNVNKNFETKLNKFKGGFCLGIDTGCVFGGKLTAAIFDNNKNFELISISAKRNYFSY